MTTDICAAHETLDEALERELSTLEHSGLRRSLRQFERRPNATLVVDGRDVADFASNDYLGLAADPRIAEAVRNSVEDTAYGAGAARLISGNTILHQELEREIAAYEGTEAAILFATGYMANIGAIPALAGKRDVIYADASNHASLTDACRLSAAQLRVFPHRDMGALDRLLADDLGQFRRRLIVVDSVFSMDGDLFPLDELAALARDHGAWSYVDDAHATGVLGATGRGAVEHFGAEGGIDVVMGALGKALGTSGAFIAGSRSLIDLMMNRARTFLFTTATPPCAAVASLAALRIARDEPARRSRLVTNMDRFGQALADLGIGRGENHAGHIVPIIIGEARDAVRVADDLLRRGFLVGAVRPPTVPSGTARLRITISAAQTDRQIKGLAAALAEVLPLALARAS